MPLVLFLLAVASYALLIPWIGFIWDDFPIAWIADRLGSAGLDRYFSSDRPLLSWLYRVTVALLGTRIPWHWHVFAILTRFTATLSFYGLMRTIWSKYAHLAVWAGLFFLVYPGFKQQWASIIYGHFFLVLTGLLVSFYLNVRIVQQESLTPNPSPTGRMAGWRDGKVWHARLSSVFAWLLSLLNLLLIDYLFFLELIRPILLWTALRGHVLDKRKRLWKVLRSWFPYLALWVGAILWKVSTLQNQPHRIEITFFEKFQETPILAFLDLGKTVLQSLWISIPVAWGMVFQLPAATLGTRTAGMAVILTGVTLTALAIYLLMLRRTLPVEVGFRNGALSVLWIGLLACLVAGWPIWLAGLVVGKGFAADRFTLLFLPGASLVSAGLIGLLPVRNPLPWLVAALLTSLAVGQQFIAANTFRREWTLQQRFFWQLTWRVPALEAGTLLLADELPFTYFTDNSLTAPVNWFYAASNTTAQMSYLLYYPARRLGTSLPGLEPGLPVTRDYRAAIFEGNTSRAVGLVFEPPACLRILEPDLDVENKMLPEVMQRAAAISSTAPIIVSAPDQPVSLPVRLYGQEPAHGWCYYFEKADLARQQKDWAQVAVLGDQAYATGDYPNDPMERLPFIEGYAHVGNWVRALELSREAQQITPKMRPVLCRLWERISETTPASQEKEITFQAALGELSCAQK